MYFKGFGGVDYSKMANFDPRTYCNTFWNISETSKNVTKYRPSDPVFITKRFQKYKKMRGHPWNILFSCLRIWFLEILESICTELFEVLEFEALKSWKCENWNSKKMKFCYFEIENLKINMWGITISFVGYFILDHFSWRWAPENDDKL